MEYCLSLSPEHPTGAATRQALLGHARQVQVAREVGFSGVFAGQHLSTIGLQWFPPFQLLAYLAPYCEGMTLGTTVAIQPFIHPILMAEAAATLDAMADGNSVLGLAAGWNRSEFRALGLSRRAGTQRLIEAIEVIRRLWAKGPVNWHGDYYDLDDVEMAFTPDRGGPPIWVGGSHPNTVRALAGASDALVFSAHLSTDDLAALQRSYVDERARLGLAPPEDVPVLRNVFVGDDRRSAAEACLPYLEASYRQYGNAGLFRDVVASNGSDPEKVAAALDERLIIGSPDEVAAVLRTLIQRLAVTRLIIRMQWYGMPSDIVERCIRRFGTEVAPQLAGARHSGGG